MHPMRESHYKRIGLVTGGEIISCGCYKARNLKNRPLPDKVGQVLGTNISRITSKKPQSNTSSGHRGVSLHCQKGKSDTWIAYIYFQGKRFILGALQTNKRLLKRVKLPKIRYLEIFKWYNERKSKK